MRDLESHTDSVSSALQGVSPPSLTDKNLSHGPGGGSEEVAFVFPLSSLANLEFEVGFVDEARGVEESRQLFSGDRMVRKALELVIDRVPRDGAWPRIGSALGTPNLVLVVHGNSSEAPEQKKLTTSGLFILRGVFSRDK